MRTFHPLTLAAVAAAIVLIGCRGPQPGTVTVTPAPAKATGSPAAAASPAPAASPTVGPVAAAASPAASPAAQPAAPPARVAAASPSPVACQIVLGFATMRDLVGAATVGECTENERHNPGNGNAEQRTTNGILIYRALDGRLLFSTADRTWIDGPAGLVERPNDRRFEWEGDRQVVEALRRGGHIIYFRHATTDRSQQDSDPTNLANCATQRNLTEQGRAQASAIGEAFQRLNIPVGPVLSSEYCRALEHARLAFDRAEAEPSLVLPEPLAAEERQRNTAALQGLLATPPPAGTNTVMVSHSPNIRDAADVDLPVEGGAAILRPNPGDKPTVVARILPDEWTVLAQALGPR